MAYEFQLHNLTLFDFRSLGEMRDRSQDISGDVRGSKSSIRASEGVTSATGEASLSQTNISEEASRESVDYEGPERLGSYGNVQDAGVDDGYLFIYSTAYFVRKK